MNNRLQFRYHSEIFDTRETAIEYIQSQIRFAESGLSVDDKTLGYSLLAEPTVLLYKKEEDETDPHLMFVIGSQTNPGIETGSGQYSDNRFCIIDIDKTEQEIADLAEELEKAIRSLTIIAQNSDTLNLYANKTEDGTFMSGDVKVAESYIYEDVRYKNNLMVIPDGIFIYVNLDYDEENERFVFSVSNADGTITKTTVNFSDNYLVSGYYDKTDESIHLQMRDGEEVVVDCEDLIAEWGVEGEASKTPVVLTREEVDYDHTDEHHHVEPWQDVLRADVRIKDERKILMPDGNYKYVKDENSTNILDRTSDGRYLYVDGKASNIIYYMNGEKTTVKAALDELSNIKLSTDSDNIIVNKTDGFFASTKLSYVSKENKLVFKVSGQEDTVIKLNGFKLFENIYYDPTQEALVITYIDGNDNVQIVTIPIGEMIRDWEWEPQNEGHNVKIVKKRNVAGNDKVSADVKIYDDPDNILVDKNHELFVKGTADNIKYENGTVKDALDSLKAKDEELEGKINDEIARAEAAEQVLDNKIGTGFTDDPHENVTYKFEQLQTQVNNVSDELQNEISRSITKDEEHDGKIQAIEDEIGDGFGPRNTVRDEIDNLQNEIEAVSGDSLSRLSDVINEDESIDVETRNDANGKPTIKVVKVNLSQVQEEPGNNIIRLEPDGIYAGVDLEYYFDSGTSKNVLVFKTTNGTKTFDLKTNSVVDKIYYDPTREAIIIEYTVNGHRMPDVVVPVGDLINEWRVEDGHPHAVQLEKTRESGATQDVLKASVVITDDHDDNILVMDDGALYVSGQGIEDNARAIEELDGRVDVVENSMNGLQEALREEVSARTLADETLGRRIDQEIADRIADVDSEQIRAISAETALQTAIETEATRATTEETRILHLLEDETSRAESAESLLQNNIDAEETRAREVEGRLERDLNAEIARAQLKEGELNNAIVNETLRAQAADNELYQKIADETADRATSDADLQSQISQEVSRAQVAENGISERLASEISRSVAEDERLASAITQEKSDREEADAELAEQIRTSKLTFEDTTSIDFNNPYFENNVVKANVKVQGGDNIIKIGQGLYATATLEYEPTGNKLRLVTSNGAQEYIQLVGATLLDSITYDPVNKMLIIRYTDGTGSQRETSVGVTDLWNEWIVQNPSEKSAVEMAKTIGDPGNPDTIGARVLITDDRDGDGKPDDGSTNVIEIKNNGLFVDGTPIEEAKEIAECVQNEIKVLEKAVIGHIIGEECGSGYTYEQNNLANYINTATSFNNADLILDFNIKRVENYIDEVSAKTDCVDNKVDKTYEMLYGPGATMPECGEGAVYQPYVGACIISGATSFNEADHLLNDQICEILTMWVSGKTCSTESDWVEDGANRRMQVDVRLSRGRFSEMTDDDVYIEDLTGDYIDPTTNEFTDTNVLRIACIKEGPSGTTPSIDSMQNGIYLSNKWDCGLYYDANTPADQEAKAKAQAAGYNTNYSTDTDASASNYNYMNNVRQSDIPH